MHHGEYEEVLVQEVAVEAHVGDGKLIQVVREKGDKDVVSWDRLPVDRYFDIFDCLFSVVYVLFKDEFEKGLKGYLNRIISKSLTKIVLFEGP